MLIVAYISQGVFTGADAISPLQVIQLLTKINNEHDDFSKQLQERQQLVDTLQQKNHSLLEKHQKSVSSSFFSFLVLDKAYS